MNEKFFLLFIEVASESTVPHIIRRTKIIRKPNGGGMLEGQYLGCCKIVLFLRPKRFNGKKG